MIGNISEIQTQITEIIFVVKDFYGKTRDYFSEIFFFLFIYLFFFFEVCINSRNSNKKFLINFLREGIFE